MHRILKLLVILSLLWCAGHFDEPAQAHETVEQHQLHVEDQPGQDEGSRDGPADAAHTGHQHCPLAPDQRVDPFRCAASEADAILASRPVSPLTSRSQAPPLQPPSA